MSKAISIYQKDDGRTSINRIHTIVEQRGSLPRNLPRVVCFHHGRTQMNHPNFSAFNEYTFKLGENLISKATQNYAKQKLCYFAGFVDTFAHSADRDAVYRKSPLDDNGFRNRGSVDIWSRPGIRSYNEEGTRYSLQSEPFEHNYNDRHTHLDGTWRGNSLHSLWRELNGRFAIKHVSVNVGPLSAKENQSEKMCKILNLRTTAIIACFVNPMQVALSQLSTTMAIQTTLTPGIYFRQVINFGYVKDRPRG